MAPERMTVFLPLLLCALLAGQARAARPVQGAIVSVAMPPVWPDAFEMEYTVTLPYLEAIQPGGLRYPVHVWWDGPAQRFRLDVYGGMDSTGWDTSKGVTWNLYARIDRLACDFSNGTAGPTAAAAAPAALLGLLREGGQGGPLPDISGWAYAGTAQVGNTEALVWQLTERHGEKTASYSFYTARNGWPLRFYMLGVNVLTGSHFDEYIIEFNRFKPSAPPAAAFALPTVCRGAGANTAAAAGGLAVQLGALLPAPRLGGAHPEGTPAPLRSVSAWAQNAQLVDLHNSHRLASSSSSSGSGSSGYGLSLNHFAHMTHGQWAATSLGLRRRAAPAGLAASSTSASARGSHSLYRRVVSDGELPASVDWRGTGADGPGVKDQVSCGSCWAFGVVGALQGAWWKATGQSLSLSEQQLVDCSWEYGNDGCAGGYIEPTLQYIIDGGGVAQEADYPYLAQNGFCRGPITAPNDTALEGADVASGARTVGAGAAQAQVPLAAQFSGFVNVPSRDEGALMEAVALHGPVAVLMNAGRLPFKFYSEGVYHNEECGEGEDSMDHVVLLVGYGTSPDGTDYWLIKNSWSKYWGMDGYARISRKGNDCGITTDPVFAQVAGGAARAQEAARGSVGGSAA